MNFKPMTDEEIALANLIKDDTECFAEVKEANDHVSKDSGKESIKLKLNVWDNATNRGYIDVYLTPSFMKLFKHACTSMLSQEQYESGNIQAIDFQGKSCNVIIGIQKDKNGKYPDKNVIKDFLIAKNISGNGETLETDNLPF